MAMDRSKLTLASRQINIQMDQLANQSLAATGLTGGQAHALLYILRHSEAGASVTGLHQASGYSKATISHLIKRLREKGYVRVEFCQEDNRRRLLFSTEKGRQVQCILEESIRGAEEQLYRGFSDQELSVLDNLQKRMLQNLSQYQTSIQ